MTAMSDLTPTFLPTSQPRIKRPLRLQWEETQHAWVLLYPEGMIQLNGSAGEIMQRVDGRRTVNDLVLELEQVFAQQGLMGDVLAFLDIAHAQNWIDDQANTPVA
jgi:pyrroloquinoline quinone biosynthesis protein D